MRRGTRHRIVGMIAACAASLSLTGALPLLAADDPSCCCEHHAKDCRCPACAHARELAAGHAMVETCAPRSPSAILVMHEVVTPMATAPLPPAIPRLPIDSPAIMPAPDPVPEIPTPPPLARS
ncbi:MAG TPA: hypothetical protein VG496_12590 [Myxococcales bacterium]|nr:hypothetical protein [Myxococcales bacterium]